MATQGRRNALKALGAGMSAASALSLSSASRSATPARGKVVVVGGGYGGATVARYIRMWSMESIDVALVEPNAAFVSCPLSNLVLGGSKTISDVTVSYENLVRRHGIKLIKDTAVAVDPEQRTVKLEGGDALSYDRLVLSPAVDFMWDAIPSLASADAQRTILHAWKAGSQTVALRRQLEAMPDGGVFAISIPVSPYRCPPGPYERACQVAWYFRRAKPKSKVLILDANDDVTSKGPLFKKAWAEEYRGIVEYRPNYALTDVDVATLTAKFDVQDDVKAEVLNVIPPQRAANIARKAGVVTANDRWCDVEFLTFESVKVKNVHVLGDAIQTAPLMPRSGHMANQQAKVCAAAIVALLSGEAPSDKPVLNNTCYSFITDKAVVHIASVHQYDAQMKTFIAVPGAGGLSPAMSEAEGRYAFDWARSTWADALA
jgi:NADPH-dependent 2,4-dienoyl-CoA reductase/sulfur reductase-like enzyme